MDVNHHVTQYINIIGDLNLQIARLKGELSRAEPGAALPESEEVTSLCDRLKSLVIDQRILGQQLQDAEMSLVQNMAECQQRQTVIQEWEQKRDDFNLATLTASPSPSLCTDSPVVDGTNADPLISQYETLPSNSEESYHVMAVGPDTSAIEFSSMCPGKALEQHLHDIHESSLEADPVPLKEPNNIDHSVKPSSIKNEPASLSVEDISYSHKEPDNSKLNLKKQTDSFVKPRHVLPGCQLLVPISPEPDADYSLAVTGEQDGEGAVGGSGEAVTVETGERMTVRTEEVTVTEPEEVQVAREELAMLETKKEKVEKHYKAFQKKLGLTRESIDEIKEVTMCNSASANRLRPVKFLCLFQDFACADGFLPTRKEIVDLLLSTSDMEASSMQNSLSTTLLRAHLAQQTSLIQQLLQHSATLLSLLERQRGLLEKGKVESMSGGVVKDLDQRFSEVSEKQRRLAAQVADVSFTP